MTKLKGFLGILVFAMFALLLVACKPEDEKPVIDEVGKNGEIIDFSDRYSEKTTITVWIDDEQGDYMKAVIDEFQKLNPGIVVIHQHKGSVDSREHLKTFGPSGNGADVFQFPHDHLSSAILEDLVLPLPSEVRDRVSERAHPLGMDIATLNYNDQTGQFDPSAAERLFAIPMSLEAVGLYYNRALIDEEDVPTTYEDLIAKAEVWNATIPEGETLTNAQLGNYYYGTTSHWADSYFIQHIYSAFGFTPFGPNLNDPSSVGFAALGGDNGALAWMRDELKPVTTGTGGTDSVSGGTRFAEGTMPLVLGGPWNIEGFKSEGVDFGIAQLPSINGNETAPYAGAMMAAVYKYSPNQAAAIRFVEFLSSDIAMNLQFEYKSKLPALKTELLSEDVQADEHLMAMSVQLNNAVPMPTIPEVQYFWGPGEDMVKEVWNAGIPIATAVADAETGYQSLKNLGN